MDEINTPKAFSFGLRGPMKKLLKSQIADFRSSRMFAGAAASNEKALVAPHNPPNRRNAIPCPGPVSQFAAIPHYHPTLAEIWTRPAEELS
jgi:hypothetical protein